MKKTILTILLCGITLLGVTGCRNTKNEIDVGEKSDIQVSQNNVSLSIKDDTLTNIGATLILKNDSDKLLYYDAYYKMEIKQNGEWHKINVELEFDDPLWKIEKNKSEEFELKWEHGYGKLTSGEYRIIKKVYLEQEEKFYTSAEFTIQ